MSGGKYNYIGATVANAADDIAKRSSTPLRTAFITHLRKVAIALYDIELVDSGDRSPGSEDAAIRDVISPTDELRAAVAAAEQAEADLRLALELAADVEK